MVLLLWFNRNRPLTEICGKQPCSQFLAYRNANRTRKFYFSSNVDRKPTRNPKRSVRLKVKTSPTNILIGCFILLFSWREGFESKTHACLTSNNRSKNHNCRCIIYMSTICIRCIPIRCSSNLQHGGMISGMFRVFCDRKTVCFRFHVWPPRVLFVVCLEVSPPAHWIG